MTMNTFPQKIFLELCQVQFYLINSYQAISQEQIQNLLNFEQHALHFKNSNSYHRLSNSLEHRQLQKYSNNNNIKKYSYLQTQRKNNFEIASQNQSVQQHSQNNKKCAFWERINNSIDNIKCNYKDQMITQSQLTQNQVQEESYERLKQINKGLQLLDSLVEQSQYITDNQSNQLNDDQITSLYYFQQKENKQLNRQQTSKKPRCSPKIVNRTPILEGYHISNDSLKSNMPTKRMEIKGLNNAPKKHRKYKKVKFGYTNQLRKQQQKKSNNLLVNLQESQQQSVSSHLDQQ